MWFCVNEINVRVTEFMQLNQTKFMLFLSTGHFFIKCAKRSDAERNSYFTMNHWIIRKKQYVQKKASFPILIIFIINIENILRNIYVFCKIVTSREILLYI